MKNKTLEERKTASAQLAVKFPNFVPIFIEKQQKSQLPQLPHSMYQNLIRIVMKKQTKFGEILNHLRNKIKIPSQQGLFLYIRKGGKKFLCAYSSVQQQDNSIYQKIDQYTENDGWIYFVYTGQQKFGDDNIQ